MTTAITKNDQVIYDDASVYYFDDVCADVQEMESDETLIVLKNPLPEKIGLTASSMANYAAIFFGSVEVDTSYMLRSMKSRRIINPHFAERLSAMLDGYAEVNDVDTVYGPAIAVRSPLANELSGEALMPLIEKRYIEATGYFSVIIDAEPIEQDEDWGDGVDRHFVRVIEKSLNDEDYEKHDAEMSSDSSMPFAVVTTETLLAIRQFYDSGIIGELGAECWAFNNRK